MDGIATGSGAQRILPLQPSDVRVTLDEAQRRVDELATQAAKSDSSLTRQLAASVLRNALKITLNALAAQGLTEFAGIVPPTR